MGVFGGTFDPPHLGHTGVASDVADHLELERVLWIPAGEPPHKSDRALTPAPVRLRMVRAALSVDERFQLSETEIRREGPSYTVDTLSALRRGELADARVFLIIGIDQYRDFDDWHRPDEIRTLATLAVMDRGGEGMDHDRAADTEGLVRVPVRRIDISSTMVRRQVREGVSIAELVHPEVARIIQAEGLYRDAPD